MIVTNTMYPMAMDSMVVSPQCAVGGFYCRTFQQTLDACLSQSQLTRQWADKLGYYPDDFDAIKREFGADSLNRTWADLLSGIQVIAKPVMTYSIHVTMRWLICCHAHR
jgi:hypothetical protein